MKSNQFTEWRHIISGKNRAKLYLNNHGMASLGDLQNDDAEELLIEAECLARKLGAVQLAAPMNGDTWHSYRTIIEDSERPRFILEPDSPLTSQLLLRHGFSCKASYLSTAIDDLSIFSEPVKPLAGLTVRNLRKNQFERELHHIYELSLRSFSANYLYSSISFEEFCNLYLPLAPMIEEEHVWLAFIGRQLVGFVFNLPDIRNYGQVVLKTIAVDPSKGGLGIGRNLYDIAHHHFFKAGFKSAVHALFKDDNRSALLSRTSDSRVIRRYGLFIKDLQPLYHDGPLTMAA